MGCGCDRTIDFLRVLGCAHAAKMHAARASLLSAPASDWPPHMLEEEQRLFPLLEVRWPHEVAALRSHHATFRRELAAHGRITSSALLEAHASLEDALVVELLRAQGHA